MVKGPFGNIELQKPPGADFPVNSP